MPGTLQELLEVCPPEVFSLIVSYLDVTSLSSLQRALPRLRSPRQAYQEDAERIYRAALQDFAVLMGRAPRVVSGSLGSDPSRRFEFERLRLLHQVVQLTLAGVNHAIGEEAELNVITGEDLLYTVGRLSMMINEQDFLANDTRAIPLNWMPPDLFKARTHLSSANIEHISRGLTATAEGQRRQTAPFRSYVSDARFRVYQIVRRSLLKNLGGTLPIAWTPADMLVLDLILRMTRFMGARDATETILKLARMNKRFLVLVSLMPPDTLLEDAPRRDAVVKSFTTLAKVLARKKNLLENTWGKNYSLDDLVKAKRSALIMNVQQMEKAFGKTLDGIDLMKAMQKPEFRNMALPWGNGRHVGMAYAGSVRLIFSQALSIMHRIGDDSSAALDLSYERIVDYLDLLPPASVIEELSRALRIPGQARNPFFGELAILLVGIEGSQNNMTVLQAPMCLDLVANRHLTWAQVLFQRQDIPFFVMGADKNEKGLRPMVRHSQMLSNGALSSAEQSEATYPKFQRFFQRELDLNLLFFKVFFPQIAAHEEMDQLILSALCTARYLCSKFNVSGRAQRMIFHNLARVLTQMAGGGSKGDGKFTGESSSKEKLDQRGEEFRPSPSGQVYPVHLGLAHMANQTVSPEIMEQWYSEMSAAQPSRALLERLDRVITHLDWQVAEQEPDPYERAEFGSRVREYAGRSRKAFHTWQMFKKFCELRDALSRRVS